MFFVGNFGVMVWYVIVIGVCIDNVVKYVGDFNGWCLGVMVGMGE